MLKSNNNIDNIPNVRKVLNKSELLVRTNQSMIFERRSGKAIAYGADVLMLQWLWIITMANNMLKW